MWQFEHSEVSSASDTKVWNLWTDVVNWPQWFPDLVSGQLHGEFVPGTSVSLQLGRQHLQSIITSCEFHKDFTLSFDLFLAKMQLEHVILEQGEMHKLTYRINISGPLAFLWSKTIGRKLSSRIPAALQKLINLAEQLQAPTPF
jgi:hypothetical protein